MSDSDPLLSTADIIEDARRPILIARHKDVVLGLIADLDSTALDAVSAIDEASQERFSLLADNDKLHTCPVSEALMEQACLAREHGTHDEAGLRDLIATFYRHLRDLLAGQLGGSIDCSIDDLGSLTCGRLRSLLLPRETLVFGSKKLQEHLVFTAQQAEDSLAHIRMISHAEGADTKWHEAAGDPPLPREVEEPLQNMSESQRIAGRTRLVQERIRQRFFKKVFLGYFDRDTLDPNEIAAHPCIVDWLHSIANTPHLYPFMQGQTQSQKIFRLRQLWRTIMQLNELYQRMEQAFEHPSYRHLAESQPFHERLRVILDDRFPPLSMDQDFILSTARCPFDRFASWVQEKVAEKEFALPPEPSQKS